MMPGALEFRRKPEENGDGSVQLSCLSPTPRVHPVQRPDNEHVPDNPDDEQGNFEGHRHPEESREVGEAEEEEGRRDVQGDLLPGLMPGHEAHDDDEGREEEVRDRDEFKRESHAGSPRCAVTAHRAPAR
jgi:hypothetical protein